MNIKRSRTAASRPPRGAFSAGRHWWPLLAVLSAGPCAVAQAAPNENSWTFAIDNDWLALSSRDANYTGGFFFTLSGPDAARSFVSLDGVLGAVDGWWLPGATRSSSKTALQFGAQAYTPRDKASKDVVEDDRPYAGLFSLTSTRMVTGDHDQPVWSSSFTVGLLGTSAGKALHRGLHKLFGSDQPEGYDHQISKGGEPTLKYTARRQALLGETRLFGSRADFKYGVEGSLGYLTEAALLASGRWGKYSTPWWSLFPEHTEYYTPDATSHDGDLYLTYGLGARLRGYNALIQGQFRHSDHTLSYSKLEKVLGEAHLGLTWGITRDTTLSYLVRYQTSEIKRGDGSKDTVSGSLYLNVGY